MRNQKINSLITNQNCRLSVQISLTGLSFLVSSLEGEPVYFFEKEFDNAHNPEELLFELQQLFKNKEELRHEFTKVVLIYTTNNYSLVPSSLFDENKVSEYLKFNTKILSNDFISHDFIDNHDAVVVYVPFININNYIFEKYGSFEYYHSASLLLKYLLSSEKHAKDTKVHLHITREQFECIIINQGNLQLCNSYTYKTPEDFIYYVLFCFEQLKLNPDTIETIVFGAISETDDIFKVLYTYIRNVHFMEVNLPEISEVKNHEQYLLKTTL